MRAIAWSNSWLLLTDALISNAPPVESILDTVLPIGIR
jgi:hypothetical protein